MKKSYTFLTMLLTVFALASCVKEFDNENNSPAKGTLPIEFTIADDATRTLLDLTDGKTVAWEDGDVVGLYYRYTDGDGNKIVSENADNVPYKYDAKTGKFIPVGEPATWDGGEAGVNHILYIYYPYTDAATAYNEIPTAVPSSQTYDVTAVSNPIVSKAFSGSRLQNATYGEAAAFGPVIQSFAILRLNITNVSGSDVVVSEVKVTNDSHYIASDNITMTHASNVSVSGGSAPQIRKKGDKTSKIITVTVENGAVAAGESIDVRMLILPNDEESTYTNTYEGSKFTVTVTSDKGEHPAITFDGGKIGVGGRASKNIVLQTPSASEDQEMPEYTIGQAVGGGVLYKIDGTTGYVLYPYAAEKKWITTMQESTVGIGRFAADGREAVAAMKATTAGIENYPAAKYCDDLEGDWYLPSENELIALFDVYTGNDILESYPDRSYFKVTPAELQDQKYRDARKTFDGYILACASDGHILNTAADTEDGDVIWSLTTASSGTKARYIRFGKYGYLSIDGPKTSKYARCIKRVDLTAVDQPKAEETYPAPTAGTEGEYDVYLLIGQSNMAGRGELLEEDKTEIPNVYILNTKGEIEPAKNPLNIYSSIRKGASSQKMGPGASFASTIAAQTGKKVLLVVNARGGSAISQWQKGVTTSSSGNTYGPSEATSADFYNEAVTRTKQAMQYGALKGILWHQGCSDQSNTSYMTQLMKLANNLRTDLGGNVPFIAGQLGDWRTSSKNFNVWIQGIGQYLTYSDWVSSADCIPIVTADSSGEPDLTDPHFDRASQILIGKRYAQKILKMVYETDYTVE